MEPPSFPAGPSGGRTLRAAPGGEATFLLPLPAGTPPFIFEWSRAGVKLGDRFATSEDAGGVRLTVSAAKVGDSGVYTLQASNAAGKDTTRVRLEVSPEEMPTGEDPPNFLRRLQDLTVKVGTRTRFLVEIISSTECRVTWYRNERRLLEAERIALVRDGNFWCADISAVSVDDAGRWTCTAENVGGRASCSAHLNVLVPKAYKRPEFVEELRALLTEQGTVSLECKVVGVPTPVLRWFKDSCEIKAGDVFALTANAEDPTSLGTYTCEAINCMGRAYSSSKVHVVGRASRESSARPSSGGALLDPPPIFTKELEDQFLRICEPLTISCNIVVPPWPRSVIWYNKEGKIEASERYHVLEDGVGGYLLEVPSAEWPDEGEWKCVATSPGGRVGISTCYVSMDVPKNYRKPRFMENLQAVLTEEGLVSFECKVVGFPTPVLSWFKDGQELKPGDVYQLTGTNSLGSYCCIARNCMGQASSSAELTVEDIQNQLNEEEKLQLFSKNQAPKFLQGLKSVEAKIDEPFRFTIKVAIPPEPAVMWYRDDQPVDESSRCHHGKEERGVSFLDIQNLEFMDQAEWKCVAMNDYGHSVTSCFLKLIIPRHYKKPRFLENLQAILSDEGAVNLECKVIGVPQPVLKWYKDGEELKPGDIHRIISGQDGTCCLGTYTCEAQNCMGIASSSASLLGFEDSMKSKNKKKTDEQALQRNLSLSTIHEERTSQMYDTPVGDITLDERGEISFSFDGKEVSVSLYETPDLTEEEALQIVEMYADQLSENVTEHNVVELPPLRFVKETSTSGNLLMEAIIIDVSPEYFTSPEEDLRTEADIEDISIADENGPPQLSLDQEIDGEDYLEKTIALMSEEKVDFPIKLARKKSDSQKSVEDYYSLSRDQSISDEKKDDDTQPLSESDLQSFASARSSGKPKSKSSKPSIDDGQESSDMTKTVLLREEIQNQPVESDNKVIKNNQQRRRSRSSRKSSSGSDQSLNKLKDNILEVKLESKDKHEIMDMNRIKSEITNINSALIKVINEIQIVERDIILKSEYMSTAATATKSLEIINSLLSPLSEIHSITDVLGEIINEPSENIIALLNRLPQPLEILLKSLTIVCKCIDVENDNKTLVKKTSISVIEKCGSDLHNLVTEISDVSKQYENYGNVCSAIIENETLELINIIDHSVDMVNNDIYKNSEIEINTSEISKEVKHLKDTQKGMYDLRSSLKSLLEIINNVDFFESSKFNNIKKCAIILNDMSIPIQDLQAALEYIEILSITETKSNLPKYNTEIIENIMESIIQLRASFKKLSAEADKNEDENDSNQILVDIKFYINDISLHLNDLEAKTGKFDILYNDNKFDVLQKMAQILIALENNLPLLETIPDTKLHMSEFHKNLTKILENVIESDDSKKYLDLLDICDGINRINSSLKSIESNTELSLANICNTLKIIKENVDNNIFLQHLNQSISSNIKNVLVSIESLYNIPEETTLNSDLEIVQDLSTRKHNENNVNITLERIDQTIAVLSSITPHETVKDLIVIQTFNNICPILEDIKYNIANIMQEAGKDEKTSHLESLSYTETIAHQICELHKTINVLNQVLYECTGDQDSSTIIGQYAKPLIELNTTLQILQQDVISQYTENTSYPDFDSDIANILESLRTCVILVQEHQCIEGLDDMSTLEDISGIKSVADIVSCEALARATVEETNCFQFSEVFLQSLASTSVQELQLLNNQIIILQNPEFLEDLKSLLSINEYNKIKSIICKLEAISSSIQVILESTQDIPSLFSSSVYKNIVQSFQEIEENLSIIEMNNVKILINASDKQKLVLEKFVELKNSLNESLIILEPSIELANSMIDMSKNIAYLRSSAEILNSFVESITMKYSNVLNNNYLTNIKQSLTNFLEATNCPCVIKLPHLKEVIQKFYAAVIMGQDQFISFTAPSAELLAETTIIDTIHNINNIVTSLEQYNFIKVSHDLDIPCLSLNAGIKTKSITQVKVDIEDILDMLRMQDSPNEHIMLVKDFCDRFKNEITLLQYLIEDPPSSKRVIKLFQVFYSVRSRLQNFKLAHQHYILSEDINKCLIKFFDDTEEYLKHVQLLLTEVIESYSDILFDIPIANINSIEANILTVLESSDESHFQQLISKFVNIISTIRPCFENIKSSVIQELYLNATTDPETLLKVNEGNSEFDIFNTLLNILENIKTNDEEKDFYESILDIIRQHKDYEDALGSGKQLILVKCLSDCSKILKEKLVNISTHEILKEKDVCQDSSTINLVAINHFLENLSIQLQNIYEQRSLEIEKADLTLAIKSADIEHINEISENLEQISHNDNFCLNDKNLCIVIEIHRKIEIIKNNLNSIENKSSLENVDLLQTSIEKTERILQKILSSENIAQEKIKNLKENTENLVQHMEQYIEIIEIVEEISAIIKLDELKESTNIAKELLQNIEATETANNSMSNNVNEERDEKVKLAQKLQKALISFQAQVFEDQQEFAPAIAEDVRQQIIKVVSDLQSDLVALTGMNIYLIEHGNRLSDKVEINSDAEAEEKLIFNPNNEIEESKNEQSKDVTSRLEKSQYYATVSEQDKKACSTTLSEELMIEKTNQGEDFSTLSSQAPDSTLQDSPAKSLEIIDSLKDSIKEYISDNTIGLIYKLSPLTHSEHINHTVKVAEQLLNCSFCEEPLTQKGTSIFSVEQYELVLSLFESLSIMSETIFEQTRDKEDLVKYEMDHVKNIINNLRGALQSYLTCSRNALQLDVSLAEQDSFTIEEEKKSQEMIINTQNTLACQENNLSDAQIIPNYESLLVAKESKNIFEEDSTVKQFEENTNEKEKFLVSSEGIIENLTAMTTRAEQLKVNKINIYESAVMSASAEDEKYKMNKDDLVNQLKEYICDETLQSIIIVPSVSISENINESIEIARQLQKVTLMEGLEALNLSNTQLNLALKLEKTLLPICEKGCDTPELSIIFESEEAQKAQTVALNLQKTLKTLITLTLSQVDQQILELDEFKVIITKDPFNYHIMIKEERSNILFSEEVAQIENVYEEASPLSIPLKENVLLIECIENDNNNELLLVEEPKLIEKVKLIVPQDDVKINSSEDLNIIASDLPPIDEENLDSLTKLSKLFEEANETIHLTAETLSIEESESLQNTLDEVQIVIMKLKYDYDGATKETFNEIIEDLECNVRSVQIQIKEHSPSCQLKEACVNLQALHTHLCEISDIDNIKILATSTLNDCSSEAEQSIELLEKATTGKSGKNLENIISNLNNIKETMKFLRKSFVSDADTLILGGIEIMQNIDKIEEKIFCLEKDIETEIIDPVTRDSIITAVHSVYGNISNMRGAVSSIQKKYLYENYAVPSRSFLHSIKNTKTISKYDNQSYWNDCAIVLRKVLNHFEDVKFYIHFDKTARLPSDATFTKIILNELRAVVSGVNQLNIIHLDKNICKIVQNCLNCVSQHLSDIENKTTLEVKDKIPMFKSLATNVLSFTNFLMDVVEKEASSGIKEDIEVSEIASPIMQEFALLENNTTYEDKELEDKDEVAKHNDLKEITSDEQALKSDKEENGIQIDKGVLETKLIDNGTESKIIDASDNLEAINKNNEEINLNIEKVSENINVTQVEETIQNRQENIINLNTDEDTSSQVEQIKIQNNQHPSAAKKSNEPPEEETFSEKDEHRELKTQAQQIPLQEKNTLIRDEDSTIKFEDQQLPLVDASIEREKDNLIKDLKIEDTKIDKESQQQSEQIEKSSEKDKDSIYNTQHQQYSAKEEVSIADEDTKIKVDDQQKHAQLKHISEQDEVNTVEIANEKKFSHEEKSGEQLVKDENPKVKAEDQEQLVQEEKRTEKDKVNIVKITDQQKSSKDLTAVVTDKKDKEQLAHVDKITETEINKVMIEDQEKQEQLKSPREECSTEKVEDSRFDIQGKRDESAIISDENTMAIKEDYEQLAQLENSIKKVKEDTGQISDQQDETLFVNENDSECKVRDLQQLSQEEKTIKKHSDKRKIRDEQKQEVETGSNDDNTIIEIGEQMESTKQKCGLKKEEDDIVELQNQQKSPQNAASLKKDESTKVKEEDQRQPTLEKKSTEKENQDQQKYLQEEKLCVKVADTEGKGEDQQQIAHLENTSEKDKVDTGQISDLQKYPQHETSIVKDKDFEVKVEDQNQIPQVEKTAEKVIDEVKTRDEREQKVKSIAEADINIVEILVQLESPNEEYRIEKDEDNRVEIQNQQQSPQKKTSEKKDENCQIMEDDQQQPIEVEKSDEKENEVMKQYQQKSLQDETSVEKNVDNDVKIEEQQKCAQAEKTSEQNYDEETKIQEQQKHIQKIRPITGNEDIKIKIDNQQRSEEEEQQIAQEEKSSKSQEKLKSPVEEKSTEKDKNSEIKLSVKIEDQQVAKVEKYNQKQKDPQENFIVQDKDNKVDVTDQEQRAKVETLKNKDKIIEIMVQGQCESPRNENMKEKDEDSKIKKQGNQISSQEEKSIVKYEDIKIKEEYQDKYTELKSTEKHNDGKVNLQEEHQSSQEELEKLNSSEEEIVKDEHFKVKNEDQQQLPNWQKSSKDETDKIETQGQQKLLLNESSLEKQKEIDIQEHLKSLQEGTSAEKVQGKGEEKTSNEKDGDKEIIIKYQQKHLQETKSIETDDIKTVKETSIELDEVSKIKNQEQQNFMNKDESIDKEDQLLNETKSSAKGKHESSFEDSKIDILNQKELSRVEISSETDTEDKLKKEDQQHPSCQVKSNEKNSISNQKLSQEERLTEANDSSQIKSQEQPKPERDAKSVEEFDESIQTNTQNEQKPIEARKIIDNDGNFNHNIEDQQKLLHRDKSIKVDKDSRINIKQQPEKPSQQEKSVDNEENKIEILNQEQYEPEQKEKSKEKVIDNGTKIQDQDNPAQIENRSGKDGVDKISIQSEEDHKELRKAEKSIKKESDDILNEEDIQQHSCKEKSIKKDSISKVKREDQQKPANLEQSTEKDESSKIQSQEQQKSELNQESVEKVDDNEHKIEDQQKTTQKQTSVDKTEDSESNIHKQDQFRSEQDEKLNDEDSDSKAIYTQIEKPIIVENEINKIKIQDEEKPERDETSANEIDVIKIKKQDQPKTSDYKDEQNKCRIQNQNGNKPEIDEKPNENDDDRKDKISNKETETEKSNVKDESSKIKDQHQQIPKPGKPVERNEDITLKIEDQLSSAQVEELVKKEESCKTNRQEQTMQLEEPSFIEEPIKLMSQVEGIQKTEQKGKRHPKKSSAKLISKDTFKDEKKVAENQVEEAKANEPQKLKINDNQTVHEKQMQKQDSEEHLETAINIGEVPEFKKYKRNNKNEIGNKDEWKINQEKKEMAITNLASIENLEEHEKDSKIDNRKQRIQQPAFMELTKPDYDLQFSRPPNYISKTSGDVNENVPITKTNNKLPTIYKAQTLLFESQLRSSLPPHQRSNEEKTQVKDTIKAASESRSTLSEKRTGTLRDVRRKPVFSTYLTDRTAVESSRVKLTCSILSTSDVTITWYKNGVLLDNKQKFRSKYVEGLITLEVLNAVPSDSGEYSCTVQNEYGDITTSANLKVYPSFEASPIPPTFTRSIRDIYHVAENELVLECRIRGQPLPTITWLKNGKPIILNEHIQAHYLADGVSRLIINSPTSDDSGNYTCKAENSMWSDQISHEVYFTGKASQINPNVMTLEKIHLSRQAMESRRPHFTNVLSDHQVVSGGTIGLQVEIRGGPTRVEWLREGRSITEIYRNAQTYVDHDIYTLALTDVTEKESGLYTCRAWSSHGNVDMNASITVVQANLNEGKPATIVSRPNKDLLISVGEDLNISFRVQGEPKPKVFLLKGMRDLSNSLRVCKMTSDDYVKFTLKRSVIADSGTYCIFARNSFGCDRAFVTVVIRQRASSDNLISDWTYPMDDLAISSVDRNYKCVPDRIPSEPSAVDGGNNWVTLAWSKPDSQAKAPILAYKIESWLLGKEGGARWIELGITPRNSFDAFNLKQGEEYHFRITPRNRYGWGESVQTSVPIGIGLAGDRPEFTEILPGQLKVLLGENAELCCSFKGKPTPEIVWMKNGHELEEERGRVIINIDNLSTRLSINKVEIEDEGRYSCEATNIHGRSSTYARMAIITDREIWEADAKLKRERSAGIDGEYPPQFTMRLRDRRVQATYPVRLTCQVVGNPPPILRWFKNGEEILVDGRRVTSQDEYFRTLEIAPTRLEDGGVYEAMARNCYGAVSCRCSLVVDKGIRAYIAPEFCCGLEPLYHLSEGDELRISAVVEAYPSVGVTWYRDGVRLRPSRRAIMTLDRDGQIELALASVTRRDAGVYTCTASNEVGRASTSGKVEVISGDKVEEKMTAPPIVISPDVPYSKEPMFIRKPRSSEAHEGDTVIIECEVTGDPKPDVYWLRDFLKPDYYRDASHFKRVGGGPAYRFEIPHAKFDYTGAYSIIAKNIHGEAKAIISLQILAKDPNTSDDAHNIRFGRVEVIPHIDKELTDLLCYDGDAVEFECRIFGNPEPDIRWLHYNEIVPDGPDFETSYDLGTARLKIKQVTADDEGTYCCEASNSLGKVASRACLVVYPPGEPNTLSQRLRRPPTLLSAASTPRSTPRTTPARSMSRTPGPDLRRLGSPSREVAPKFYTYPYNRVAEEGDTIVFQCAVKGQPPPWATWDKDGIIITPSARFSIKEKDEMFKILEIEQVTIDDVGVYRITLENDYGRAEASARLEVITQKGKFYGTTRSYSVSPNKSLPYRRRTPSFSKQD